MAIFLELKIKFENELIITQKFKFKTQKHNSKTKWNLNVILKAKLKLIKF
jgi:hypothetical protein